MALPMSRCVHIAAELGSPLVAVQMYSAVGKTRLLSKSEREAQWCLSVDSMKRAADHAGAKGVKLAVESLNRFATDLLNTVAQDIDWLGRLGRDSDRGLYAEVREIARAVSIWRPLAESQDALACDGLSFLKKSFNA